jgi:hypothetical protein
MKSQETKHAEVMEEYLFKISDCWREYQNFNQTDYQLLWRDVA